MDKSEAMTALAEIIKHFCINIKEPIIDEDFIFASKLIKVYNELLQNNYSDYNTRRQLND